MLRNQDSQAEQQLTDNQKMEEVVTVTESLGSSFIFLFKQFLPLAGLGSAIFFPLAAAGGLIRGILKMREAYLEKSENKSGAILRASVEILTALAITAAAIFTPLIFIPTLAFKTLFHFFATIYYGVRSLLSPELPQQKMNREKMIMNLAFTVTHTISTVATSLVFIAEQTQFGILGVMGCMLAVAYVLCKTCSTTKQRPASLNISQLSNNRGPEAFLRKGPAISRELVEEKKLQD
ncbi:MAG TPA: hypothetical protein VLH77_02785, partial [Gammaproteobacteria bacterium]|nr:hypothetical protein [Gammaproteobacteria bacterium]